MQKNDSNLVVKTVCEHDIRAKSYREKTSVKKPPFSSLSPSLTWLVTHAVCGGPLHTSHHRRFISNRW